MRSDIELTDVAEEEAMAHVLAKLRECQDVSRRRSGNAGQPELSIPNLITERLDRSRPRAAGVYRLNSWPGSGPFYAAAWDLVARGILYPHIRPASDTGHVLGSSFNLTEFGRRWVAEASGYEAVPMEHARFGTLLQARTDRFGPSYGARAQEAAACYRTHNYLACCAMCGAAAESVLLTLAIARTGDRKQVLEEYGRSRGRSWLERQLLHGTNGHIQRELPNYLELLKYWRDLAAHGAATAISEAEAFTSLILLLRFAVFADERWDEITGRPSSGA